MQHWHVNVGLSQTPKSLALSIYPKMQTLCSIRSLTIRSFQEKMLIPAMAAIEWGQPCQLRNGAVFECTMQFPYGALIAG